LPGEERLELAGVLLLVVGGVGAIISTRLWLPLLATVAIACAAVLGFRSWQQRSNEDASPTAPTIFHDLADPAVVSRALLAAAVTQALARASACWGIASRERTNDLRRNAGAGTLVTRVPLRVTTWTPAPLNISTDALEFDGVRLAFWPDALIVETNGAITAVAYEDLVVEVSERRFAEEGPRPSDALQDGHTWRYVCKDGSPDLRFANNVQIPWLVYGELHLSVASGWGVVVQVSSAPVARAAAAALQHIASAGRAPLPAPPMPPVAPPPVPSFAPPAPRSSVEPSANPERMRDTLVVLKAIAVADRRLSPEEVDVAYESLRSLCPAETVGQTAASFEDLLRRESADVGPLYAAFRRLAEAPEPWRRELVASAHRIAGADNKLTPKERERLFEVEHNLLAGGA
jgi:hypothetical protein